jgi:hypothetical protein
MSVFAFLRIFSGEGHYSPSKTPPFTFPIIIWGEKEYSPSSKSLPHVSIISREQEYYIIGEQNLKAIRANKYQFLLLDSQGRVWREKERITIKRKWEGSFWCLFGADKQYYVEKRLELIDHKDISWIREATKIYINKKKNLVVDYGYNVRELLSEIEKSSDYESIYYVLIKLA